MALRERRFLWAGTAILLLAALLRLMALHDVPPGLSQDEVLNADIVEFIRAGRFELFFREGFGHEPLYHYFSVPFQVLLGDNVLSIRLPAVFLGLIGIALTLRWARHDYGMLVALTAGVGLAISWWAIVFGRVGIRPIMLPVFLLLMAWQWRRRPWLSGILLGLSLYTYTPATTMLGFPLLMAGYFAVQRSSYPLKRQSPILRNLLIFAIAAIVYLPLLLTLRADPTLLERGDQLSGPITALLQGDWRPLWETVTATLGVFSFTGDPRWTYSLPGRSLFDPVTAVIFYSGLLIAIARIRQEKYAFLLAWLVCGLLPSMVTPDAPSTIRMIGALPIVYILVGLAIDWVWVFGRKRFASASQTRFSVAFGIIVALLISLNLVMTIRDGFVRWPQAFETREKYQTIYADMATYLRENPTVQPVINTGFFYPIDDDSVRRNLGNDPKARWVQGGNAVVVSGDSAELLIPEYATLSPDLATALDIPDTPKYRSADKPGFAAYDLSQINMQTKDFEPVTFDGVVTLLGYELLDQNEEGAIPLDHVLAS